MVIKMRFLSLLSLVLATPTVALAQPKAAPTFPVKQVEITVPYAAGGGVDMLARLISEQLSGLDTVRRVLGVMRVEGEAGA